jgi:hypothetical protein
MSGGDISREDLRNADVIDAIELASDGTTSIFSGVTVVSTSSGTKQVVLSGVDLWRDDDQITNGDKVTLTGTTGGADGTYTVDAISTTSQVTFTVQEAIADSTGGTCDAVYPPGALRVGFDPTGLVHTTETDVPFLEPDAGHDRLSILRGGLHVLPGKSG